MNLSSLDPRITERRNSQTVNIDLASPLDIVDLMSAEDRKVADAVASQRDAIAETIGYIEQAFRAGRRLLYVGAGTSGRLGVLDASECPPTFGTDPGMVIGIIAGGDVALRTSVEGAEDDPAAGSAGMDAQQVWSGDVVVGIATSGTTPFVLGALSRAHELGAVTVLIACTEPSPAMRASADVCILPIVGPEVLAGSTRLKAGTATKMVCNMLTTGAMIRIGKSFGNLMVDLRVTNAKLQDRSERIIMEITGLERNEACALLEASEGRVKRALVMYALGVDSATADLRLAGVGGVIRRIVVDGRLQFPGQATQ